MTNINIVKICIILGTRPEIIKMSPIIRECQKRHISFFILHTGQHYSKNMDRTFFYTNYHQRGYFTTIAYHIAGSHTHKVPWRYRTLQSFYKENKMK